MRFHRWGQSLNPASAKFFLGLSSALAVVSLVFCVALIGYALYKRSRVPGVFPTVAAPSDGQKKALDARLDLSSKLSDLTLLLLGIVWGLVLAEEVAIKFSRWQDTTLFVSSNLLLLLSTFFHLLYRRRISNLLWDISPAYPDIRSRHVEFLLTIQWSYFYAGLVAVGFTLILTKVLGGS